MRSWRDCFSLAACPQGNQSLRVEVETTGAEIVQVRVLGEVSAEEEACVREATWALRLGPSFNDTSMSLHRVTLRPE